VEEVLCRGLVLRALLNRWRPGLAIAVSSLVFGAMHLDPWQFFYATWLGLLLGWVYWRTRSLGLCVLLHAVHNLLGWIMIRGKPGWMGLDRSIHQETPDQVPPDSAPDGGRVGVGRRPLFAPDPADYFGSKFFARCSEVMVEGIPAGGISPLAIQTKPFRTTLRKLSSAQFLWK